MWGRAGRRTRRDRALRRRRGRARPVLLPPPRGVPRAAGRGGDPRPHQRADPDRAPARRRLRGAARRPGEQPGADDDAILGERWRERADALVGPGELRRGRDGRYLPRGPGFPAGEISLRSASLDSVAVVERASGEVLGSVEAERAFSTVHPGRGLPPPRPLLRGRRARRRRRARSSTPSTATGTRSRRRRPTSTSRRSASSADRTRGPEAVELYFGEVSVTEQVIAYQRKRLADHSVIDLVALDLPEQNFPTQALWYVLPDELAGPRRCRSEVLLGALHAAEHSQIAVCRCWRCATAGTSAASRPTSTSRPGCRRSSSTTAIPAGSGSPAAATTSSSAWSPTRRAWSASARARTVSLLRPEPQVRQPQRAAAQGRLAGADGLDHQPDRRRAATRAGGVNRADPVAVIGRPHAR